VSGSCILQAGSSSNAPHASHQTMTSFRWTKALSVSIAVCVCIGRVRGDADGANVVLAEGSPGSPRKETEFIKAKLEGAEDRVRELVAKLDSFSVDASLAKAEIHSSFIETWQNVELLARDRCGAEVHSIRLSQQNAEAQVERLQGEIRLAAQQLEELKVQLSKAAQRRP
jgi:hypothetical protein